MNANRRDEGERSAPLASLHFLRPKFSSFSVIDRLGKNVAWRKYRLENIGSASENRCLR